MRNRSRAVLHSQAVRKSGWVAFAGGSSRPSTLNTREKSLGESPDGIRMVSHEHKQRWRMPLSPSTHTNAYKSSGVLVHAPRGGGELISAALISLESDTSTERGASSSPEIARHTSCSQPYYSAKIPHRVLLPCTHASPSKQQDGLVREGGEWVRCRSGCPQRLRSGGERLPLSRVRRLLSLSCNDNPRRAC